MAQAQITGAKAAEATFIEGKGSAIEVIDIFSNKDESKNVSIVNGVLTFLYYESILQDSVRAVVSYSDTGNSIGEGNDPKNYKTITEGLPLVGQERVNVKIQDNNQNELQMVLYVNKVNPLSEDTRKQIVQLELASREFIMNEKVRVNTRFDGKISDHIKKLLEDKKYLGPTEKSEGKEGFKAKKIDVEETENTYNFVGNNKKPYYIINWLSRGSVPKLPEAGGATGISAGFLFWETNKGLHFKSIDSLFAQEPKLSVLYNESPDENNTPPAGYDVKALEYSVSNAIDVQKKLKLGAYSTRLIVFNPFNTYYEVINPKAEDNEDKLSLAGKELPVLNKEFKKEEGPDFSRTTYMLLDPGSLPSGKGIGKGQEQVQKREQENFKPKEYLNQGIMRMNQVFSQKTTITIPGDFTLHAGDAIFVDAPQVSGDPENDKENTQTGGLYIIADLCHYISAKNTLTKLNLVRDSFGRKPKSRN